MKAAMRHLLAVVLAPGARPCHLLAVVLVAPGARPCHLLAVVLAPGARLRKAVLHTQANCLGKYAYLPGNLLERRNLIASSVIWTKN